MTRALTLLPADRLAELDRGYGRAVAAKRLRTFLIIAAVLAGASVAAVPGEVNLGKLVEGLPRFTSYFYDILPKLTRDNLAGDLAEWFWGWKGWFGLLADTLLVAYVGTFFGAFFGFSLCFLASANLTRNPWLRIPARRLLELCRTVPEIVFALMFVYAFGLRPVPGVLAIALHTTGALGKLFAEAAENIDMKPVEGATATGASWVQTVRFAVVPQVLPNFASYTLLRFEINVRGASVLGFVGAGGIGKELISSTRQFYYADVSAILLMIIVTVAIIDIATEALRHRLIGPGRHG